MQKSTQCTSTGPCNVELLCHRKCRILVHVKWLLKQKPGTAESEGVLAWTRELGECHQSSLMEILKWVAVENDCKSDLTI